MWSYHHLSRVIQNFFFQKRWLAFFFRNSFLHDYPLPWPLKVMISLIIFPVYQYNNFTCHLLRTLSKKRINPDWLYLRVFICFLKKTFLFCKFYLVKICPWGHRGYVRITKFPLPSLLRCLGQQYGFMPMLFSNISIADLQMCFS